jgi:hypothetical protein
VRDLDKLRANISIIAQATTKMIGDLNNYQDDVRGTADPKLFAQRFQLQREVIEQCLSEISAIVRENASRV